MFLHQVGYDLLVPGKDYQKLFKALEAYGWYARPLKSSWIIRTTDTAEQVCNNLKQHIDANDRLLVTALTGDAAWVSLDPKVTEWLMQQLGQATN